MKHFLNQFFSLLDPPAKKAIPFLIVAFVISSMLDVLGVGIIGLFLGLLANPSFVIEKFPNIYFLHSLPEKKLIIYSGVIIISAFFLKAVLALFIQAKVVFFCQTLSIRLKTRLMSAYQYASFLFHLQRNSVLLMSRIQDNINNYINSVLMAMVTIISNALITVAILLLLLIIHPFVTSLLIIMFAGLGLLYDWFAKRKLSSLGKTLATINGEIMQSINQGLHGLSEVRVLGREDYFLDRLKHVSSIYAQAYGTVVVLQLGPRYLIENAIAIFVVGLSLIGIIINSDKSSIVAMIGMFGAAGARLLPTVTQIMNSISQIRGNSHHVRILYNEFEQLKEDVSFSKDTSTHKEKLDFFNVHLNSVCFNYPQTNLPTLENIDLKFARGQSIGLIGPSGAGKSTLVNLILGLLEPKKGQILVNGNPILNSRAWLNNFAYIPQSIFLLDNSLRRNVALGITDEEIDEKRVLNAIQMAQLTEVVNELPQGLDTIIGENGVRLSGGQRQRVALARAFYHERNIIIMDEATSSLDNETEKEVINTIKRLKGNKTLIVIAHRLTTVEHCDVLYRLEKGHITAVGSFQEVVGQVV